SRTPFTRIAAAAKTAPLSRALDKSALTLDAHEITRNLWHVVPRLRDSSFFASLRRLWLEPRTHLRHPARRFSRCAPSHARARTAPRDAEPAARGLARLERG